MAITGAPDQSAAGLTKRETSFLTHQGPVSRVESHDLLGGGRIPRRLLAIRRGAAALLLVVARGATGESSSSDSDMRASAALQEHSRAARGGGREPGERGHAGHASLEVAELDSFTDQSLPSVE